MKLTSKQLRGVENCPHCGVASPVLEKVYSAPHGTERNDGQRQVSWASFQCSTCGGIVTARFVGQIADAITTVDQIFPSLWNPKDTIPEQARNYLSQARKTIGSPDASVLMSTAAIDAMLKDKGFQDGALFKRIDEAVAGSVLTAEMAKWAHQTRIQSNNVRHADTDANPMTNDDAERAFEFAKSIADVLYVVPSRMPEQGAD